MKQFILSSDDPLKSFCWSMLVYTMFFSCLIFSFSVVVIKPGFHSPITWWFDELGWKPVSRRHNQTIVQWNPSCKATPFTSEKWPFKRGGLSSGVEINTFMFRFTLSSGLSRGGSLSSGWPLKRGSTLCDFEESDGIGWSLIWQTRSDGLHVTIYFYDYAIALCE